MGEDWDFHLTHDGGGLGWTKIHPFQDNKTIKDETARLQGYMEKFEQREY